MIIENIYIDMCASAKEIQGDFWIPQQGDYCTSPNPDIGVGILVAKNANDWEMENEFAIGNEYLFFQQLKSTDPEGSRVWVNYLFDKKEYIFLPRADQLFSDYSFINSSGELKKASGMWDRFKYEMRESAYKTVTFNSVYFDSETEEWSINSFNEFAICYFMLDIYRKIWQDYEWKQL